MRFLITVQSCEICSFSSFHLHVFLSLCFISLLLYYSYVLSNLCHVRFFPFLNPPHCRVPLCESSLNRPRSPLTRWHNKGLSPFSPSQLSPIHHHNHQSHPFVVKSPWQPPISLSPVDGCHSQRSKFKLSVT